MKMTFSAPVECPECGASFRGSWAREEGDPDPQKVPQDQSCPQGHVFPATWPGFHFEPVTRIVHRDDPRR